MSSKTPTVLIVMDGSYGDDPSVGDLVKNYVEMNFPACLVQRVSDRETAKTLLQGGGVTVLITGTCYNDFSSAPAKNPRAGESLLRDVVQGHSGVRCIALGNSMSTEGRTFCMKNGISCLGSLDRKDYEALGSFIQKALEGTQVKTKLSLGAAETCELV